MSHSDFTTSNTEWRTKTHTLRAAEGGFSVFSLVVPQRSTGGIEPDWKVEVIVGRIGEECQAFFSRKEIIGTD
jgi:hypothetical protein